MDSSQHFTPTACRPHGRPWELSSREVLMQPLLSSPRCPPLLQRPRLTSAPFAFTVLSQLVSLLPVLPSRIYSLCSRLSAL